MRAIWFPLTLIIVTATGLLLQEIGPLPVDATAALSRWQPLIAASLAATVASIAAYIAFKNTSRSLSHSEDLERRRRTRKHAALRATLPLALAKVSDYAEKSAHALNDVIKQLSDESVPAMTIAPELSIELPPDVLETLTDFIEYSDEIDVRVLEQTVSWLQIHQSRVHGLVRDNRDPSRQTIVTRHNIETSIVDAASIYAGAGCVYAYARRRSDRIPTILTWDAVVSALRNMRFWDDNHQRLYEIAKRGATVSVGPFEKINPSHS